MKVCSDRLLFTSFSCFILVEAFFFNTSTTVMFLWSSFLFFFQSTGITIGRISEKPLVSCVVFVSEKVNVKWSKRTYKLHFKLIVLGVKYSFM